MEAFSYGRLFLAAFVAAALLSAQSELALAVLLAAGHLSPPLLIIVATAGNVLGSTVNWILGRYMHRYRGKRWFPVKESSLVRVERPVRVIRPVDPTAELDAGNRRPARICRGLARREPLPSFFLLVTIVKLDRYLVVAVATAQLL